MQGPRSYSKAVVALIICAATVATAAIDRLTLKNGKSFEGSFESFKSDRFYFSPRTGKKLHERRMTVVSLELDPLVEVVVKARGKKKRKDLKFKAYEKSKFIFDHNGKDMTFMGSQMTTIEVGMDFKRAMAHQEDAKPPAAQDADPKAVNVEANIKKGSVTIVHFHAVGDIFPADSRAASIRTGNYISSLKKKSRGKVHVLTIPLHGWDDPSAVKYEITSAPQFWIYKRTGALSSKLIERFTSTDIDAALKKAKKIR